MLRRVLIALIVLTSAVSAQDDLDGGAMAPHARWTCDDGPASRSRLSSANIRSGHLAEAWRLKLEGPLYASPLAWDENIVILEQDKKVGRAHLKVVDVGTGDVVLESGAFNCLPKARMALWGRSIAVRTDFDELAMFRIGYTKISRGARFSGRGRVRDFLIHQDRLVATIGNDLLALSPTSLRILWEKKGSYLGQPALMGGVVYAMRMRGDVPVLIAVDARTGKVLRQAPTGLRVPYLEHDAADTGSLQVGPDIVILRLPEGDTFQKGRTDNAVFFARSGSGANVMLEAKATGTMRAPAALATGSAVFQGTIGNRPDTLMVYHAGQPRALPILPFGDRKDLFGDKPQPCLNLWEDLWLADFAFARASAKLLRVGGRLGCPTPIPVKGGLLFQHKGEKELFLLRDVKVAAARPKPVGPATGKVADGRAILRSGRTVEGELVYDLEAGRLTRIRSNGKTVDYRMRDVLFIEDGKSNLVMTPSPARFNIGVHLLMKRDYAERLLALAQKAYKAGSADHMLDFIDKAALEGAEAKKLAQARKRLSSLSRRRRVRVDEKAVAGFADLNDQNFHEVVERYWTCCQNLPEDAPFSMKISLLKRLFEFLPDHKAATEQVRAWLPEALRKKKLKNAGKWLDFIVAARQIKIEIVEPPENKEKGLPWNKWAVGAAQHKWRKDIIGVRSKRMMVLTPLENPSQVARCLAMGETVCDALDKMFEDGEQKKRTSRPLIIHLFPTRESYIAFGKKRGMTGIGSTLGYYSPRENVTRMFVPAEEEALEEMRSTFVHELTHHWTFEYCPLFTSTEASRPRTSAKGAWIVEGFADMMSEFLYDPETGTFEMNNPSAGSLDVVSNAQKSQMIPWDTFMGMSVVHMHALASKPEDRLRVPLRWMVGRAVNQSPMNVFYSQASALCHFLMRAEGGKYRPALMDFVRCYFTGESRSWTTTDALGMSNRELGRRVIEFAKDTSSQDALGGK